MLLCCIQNKPAVRCKARVLIGTGVGDGCTHATGQVHHVQLESTANARDVSHPAAVRAQGRRNVVIARESDALRIATVGRHFVNLRGTTTVADKVNALTIGGVSWLGVNAGGLGQPARFTAVDIHRINLRTAIAAERGHQLTAVRRPGRRTVRALEVGQQTPFAGRHIV